MKVDTRARFSCSGKSYHDLLRVRAGALPDMPDAVLYPETESEIEAIFALACEHRWALFPSEVEVALWVVSRQNGSQARSDLRRCHTHVQGHFD